MINKKCFTKQWIEQKFKNQPEKVYIFKIGINIIPVRG